MERASPFGAPIFRKNETTSTMDDAREGVAAGAPSGSVFLADWQSAGRGRFRDRSWLSEPGQDLLFTIALKTASTGIVALPLKTGLGVCLGIERYLAAKVATRDGGGAAAEGIGAAGRMTAAEGVSPALAIKWPNDILCLDAAGGGRKTSGILCECAGGWLYAGIGVNCAARDFPPGLRFPPTSLSAEAGFAVDRLELLPCILQGLHDAFAAPGWRGLVEDRLYLLGKVIAFQDGDPGAESVVRGRIAGLGESGELLVDTGEGKTWRGVSGELLHE